MARAHSRRLACQSAPVFCGGNPQRTTIRSVDDSRATRQRVCFCLLCVFSPVCVCFPLRYIQCADLKHAGNLFGSQMCSSARQRRRSCPGSCQMCSSADRKTLPMLPRVKATEGWFVPSVCSWTRLQASPSFPATLPKKIPPSRTPSQEPSYPPAGSCKPYS